jgi:adenylate cyclase
VWVRELDCIRVKGKSRPINIYELIGDRHDSLEPKTHEFLELYAAGRAAYSSMNFSQALRYFQSAQQLRPSDRAVTVHLQRSQEYLLTPPSETWDGVHTMTTK